MKSSEVIEGLNQYLTDCKKHNEAYKKSNTKGRRVIEHLWALEYLKQVGVVFTGDKLREDKSEK